MGEEGLARFGQRHAAGMPFEEFGAKSFLKLPDLNIK
jgi:hypothetical protein